MNTLCPHKAPLNLFATAPKGLELLLADELRELGAASAAEKLAGVSFTASLDVAYKTCLWSRLASRVLLLLGEAPASTPDELYQAVQTISWDEHLDPAGSLAVQFVSSQSDITHTLFGAQKVKDAIVDQLRDKFGVRPNVARTHPDLQIYIYLYRNEAKICIDLSGESLHKRGYRLAGGEAPLKENLAAAMLLRANWPTIAKQGGSLLDPMCGSGTLLIEAAMLAGDIAPGLNRNYFGFLGWKKHQPSDWSTLVAEAERRKTRGLDLIPTIVGYDQDATAIKNAFANIERAGLAGKAHVEKRDLSVFAPLPSMQPGLVIVNPPYGERLGELNELPRLYAELGNRLKAEFQNWRAAVLTGDAELGKQMGIHAQRSYALFNGTLPCKLLLFNVSAEHFIDRSPAGENARRVRMAQRALSNDIPSTEKKPAIDMFINRLRKNMKHIKRQAAKKGLTSYCIYDADLPEYSFAIELSVDAAHVKEYMAPKTVAPEKVLRRRHEVLAVLPELLEIKPEKIFFIIIKRR